MLITLIFEIFDIFSIKIQISARFLAIPSENEAQINSTMSAYEFKKKFLIHAIVRPFFSL